MHKRFKVLGAALALTLACGGALAAEAQEVAADPALEAKLVAITSELRCLVCQNQTIADSHADLAVDLRNQVREMLQKGQSQEQILAYMTQRYGDFVLYRPPLKESTALLWYGPALLLVGGLAVLVLVLRKRNRLSADQFEADELDSVPPETATDTAHR
jgi:cytochrome c-type biogenesis protein CcmH